MPHNTLLLEPSTEIGFETYHRTELPAEMDRAVRRFERRFQVTFETATFFPKDALRDLQTSESAPDRGRIRVASSSDACILRDIAILSEIANSVNPTSTVRYRYYTILLEFFRRIGLGTSMVASEDTLVVAVEREGAVWAKALGCEPTGRYLHPHAKRIAYEEGIVVGLTPMDPKKAYRKCILIDGAIASGATLMTIMDVLYNFVDSFEVFAAHSTGQGARALLRFGDARRVAVQLNLGHLTEGLNSHYYAVYPNTSDRLVVGDLGDMISPVIP